MSKSKWEDYWFNKPAGDSSLRYLIAVKLVANQIIWTDGHWDRSVGGAKWANNWAEVILTASQILKEEE